MIFMEKLIKAMLKADAYEEDVKNVELMQTHISWVFLTGKHAYKIKKPVNLGFCDFSTLEKRKLYCEREVEINKRLSPSLYLGVVPITQAKGKIKIKGEGKIVEYAVKMRQLPQERILSNLLVNVGTLLIGQIASIIADFHTAAKVDKNIINGFGSVKGVKYNWNENFSQVQQFINKTISRERYDFIKKKIDKFLVANVKLFEKRVLDGRIRECHGDLHSGNIFVTDRIYIFDAIEFNDRFRISDVASEVAFFAMDLDFHHREDLAEYFVDKYVELSGDKDLLKLLAFYKCYRAFVRGKVNSLKSLDEEMKENEAAAKGYFNLAFRYANQI